MVDIDLSDAGLRSSGFGGVPEICGNEGDVGDCYYNFSVPELGSWFGVDMPMDYDTLHRHGFTSMTFYDDESGKDLPMQPGVDYYPVFSGMCMGWSWGLYFANEAVAHMVATAEGGDPSDALREKQIVPRISPGRPITSTYVDNVAVIGGSQADTNLRMSGISSKADSLSLSSFRSDISTGQLRFAEPGARLPFQRAPAPACSSARLASLRSHPCSSSASAPQLGRTPSVARARDLCFQSCSTCYVLLLCLLSFCCS